MKRKILDVYLHERLAGQFEQNIEGKLLFTYDPAYVESRYPPLSVTLPLQNETFSHKIVEAFFSGLLPDESMRIRIARFLGVSDQNSFSLLREIGVECAGAIALLPHEESLDSFYSDEIEIIDKNKLDALLKLLEERPLLVGTQGIQLSLAGAQNKMGVSIIDGEIALVKGSLPTTHILKPIIHHVEYSVHNEFFCMKLAKLCRIDVPEVELRYTDHTSFYLVERYDRARDTSGKVYRLHQEDFCQALAIPPRYKYENEGGPNFQACLELLKEHADKPIIDQEKMYMRLIFNYLIGNADAHGKNFSLLYHDQTPSLSPAYDLLSTAVYPQISRKMAMKIGGKYLPEEVELRHWHKIIPDTAVARNNLDKMIRKLSEECLEQAYILKADLLHQEIASPIFGQICRIIKVRSELLLKHLSKA